MKSRYTNLLLKLGLNQAELELYDYLLRNGSFPVTKLSEKVGLSRTNAYNVLSSLRRKNLVEEEAGSARKLFRARHPDSLKDLLEQKRLELASAQHDLEHSYQELVSEFSLAQQQTGVFRFAGKSGMERAYRELLKDGAPLQSIMNRPKYREFMAQFNPSFVQTRVKKRIFHRIISPRHPRIKEDDRQLLRQVRYLPQKPFPWDMDIKINSQRVVMTNLSEETAAGIIIHDPAIAKNYLILFDFLWPLAAPDERE